MHTSTVRNLLSYLYITFIFKGYFLTRVILISSTSQVLMVKDVYRLKKENLTNKHDVIIVYVTDRDSDGRPAGIPGGRRSDKSLKY